MTAPRRRFRFSLGALVLMAVSCRPTVDGGQNYLFDKQVAVIRAGKAELLYIYDRKHTDDLLKSIAGLKGLRRIQLTPCDVTPKGLEQLATFPDLTSVTLAEVPATDAWIEALQSCPNLEELTLRELIHIRHDQVDGFLLGEPGAPVSVSTVLELSHLKKLVLDCPVTPGMKQLQDAKNFSQLKLVGRPKESMVAWLRAKLPNCDVIVVPNWK